jgi:hypothetical protein
MMEGWLDRIVWLPFVAPGILNARLFMELLGYVQF